VSCVQRTSGRWEWRGDTATPSIKPEIIDFGTLEMKVSSDPEYLDMDANSGQITFRSDCSEIVDAMLFVHLDDTGLMEDEDYHIFEEQTHHIGNFSDGLCEVDVDVLQRIAKKEEMLQIDFSVTHPGIEWPMSKFSMDIDWGNDPFRADAKLETNWEGIWGVELEIWTVVPNMFTRKDKFPLRVTLLDSDRNQIGDDYVDEEFFLREGWRKFLKFGGWNNDFNCSPQDVCGVRINIDSGDDPFDKTKLVKEDKKRFSTDLIHGNLWAGEAEVDFPHQVLQETGDDGYEWSDRPRMMPHEIRSRWVKELQPLEFDYNFLETRVDVFGSGYDVKIPLITDVDYNVLKQSEKTFELEVDRIRYQNGAGYASYNVTDKEIIFDSNKNEVVARFVIYCPHTDHNKKSWAERTRRDVRLNVLLHSFDWMKKLDITLELEPLIEMIEQPYVEGNVLYFAKGKISDEDLVMTSHNFTGHPSFSSGLPWCPVCGTGPLFPVGGKYQCTMSYCTENPNNSGRGAGSFEIIKPVIISLKVEAPGCFNYGISTDMVESATKDDNICLKSSDGHHSISEKSTVLRGHCNGI